MSHLSQWHKLKVAGVVSGDMPEQPQQTASTLWYVRALQGFAGWLAALFLIGFLGIGVAGLFEHGLALMLLGITINVSSYVFFKTRPESDFFEQLVLVFSLTGQFLFAFGLFEVFGFKERQLLVWIGLYQLVLMWFINHYLHRFLSTWFAVIALFWGFDVLIYSGLGSALVAALFVWLWLDKTGWQAEQEFYEPIGYALAFSLLQLNAQSQLWLGGVFYYRQAEVSWLMQNADWISAGLNSLVLMYFVYRMVQEQRVKLSSTAGKLIVLAAVIMLFSALPVIGLSSALLVLLVGFARRNRLLMVLGGLAMIGFVSWYYYSLEITLLFKSIILMVAGLVLLLGALLLKYSLSKNEPKTSVDTAKNEPFTLSLWQRMAAVFTLLLCLAGVNQAIWQKEQVLKNGQSVFLELAPVDPRSLMQGDYMRLRFAMAQQISANTPSSSLSRSQQNHDGYVWVNVDPQGVGQFHALDAVGKNELDDVQQTAETLLKLQYRIRNNRVQFATNAFFFQEGDAKLFDTARYGQFKVAADGELLLAAMYDKDLKLLGENRLD